MNASDVSICPTVTAADADTYRRQIETVAGFARRVHIDLADGKLAPHRLIEPADVWWPANLSADIHVMYRQPMGQLEALLALRPQLVIIHAEAEADLGRFIEAAHRRGVEAGVALLQTTPIEAIKSHLLELDHVLVFSGQLGTFGGRANPALMTKVKALKDLNPDLEVGWDGGINEQNISALVRAGAEALNVGGFIHRAADPAAAYHQLQAAIGQAESMLDSRPPRARPVVAAPTSGDRLGSLVRKLKRGDS